MDGNKDQSGGSCQRSKSRAIVFRCNEDAYDEVIQYLRDRGDVYIVFSKTSFMKLVVTEEAF